ncbi:MAG: hypothetical protein JW940_11640 [Polyangiaceae bacterium]|nr:hypothetical protein [Polyangiaceae bacterium]
MLGVRCPVPLHQGQDVRAAWIIAAYIEHYHEEGNHQSLDNQLVVPRAANENAAGPVQCRERLGGMLKLYCRDAA